MSDETPDTTVEPTTDAEQTPEAGTVVADPSGEVLLSLVGPWYCQAFNTTAADGSKLTIDKNGVWLDAPAAIAILQNAAENGVSLKIGN